MPCKCYAALGAGKPLEPFTIERRPVSATDVAIDIKWAGICHSDIHQVNEDWGPAIFPMVPGHEVAGVVSAVGSEVSKFKVGDTVGVGCMVDSCRSCSGCKAGTEQLCKGGVVGTYNSRFKYKHCAEYNAEGGAPAYGGYAESMVVDESFVLSIPATLDLAAAAPLLCAGITVYSPFMYYGLKPNMKLAVMGLGGLGHMAVKFGVAFGAHVTVISRSDSKKEEACGKLGAHAFLNSADEEAVKAAADTFDMMINTIAAEHDIGIYMGMLASNGKMVCVGAPVTPHMVHGFGLIVGRKSICGSCIGGIQETQEMLDFCGRHNIVCDIEKISADKINEAYVRTAKSDVRYRFVIDISTM